MALTLSEWVADNPPGGMERGPHNNGTCTECLFAWMRGADHEVDRPVTLQTQVWRGLLGGVTDLRKYPIETPRGAYGSANQRRV